MDKHFILTHGRSGSNFLANTLNKHPSLVNLGEVLGDWTLAYRLFSLYQKTGRSLADFLDTLYSSDALFYSAQAVSAISHFRRGSEINFKRKPSIKSLGMKDFVFLLDKRGLGNYLHTRDDIKVIYLTRRNHFSRYLSLLNMQKSGVVKAESLPLESNKYTIDVQDLLTSIKCYREEEEAGDKIVEGIPVARVAAVDYEEYLLNAETLEKTHSDLFEFLGVEDIKVSSSQKKILSKDPREHIVNYGEVVEALVQAGYEKYLN
ncbi:sulfotransferase [Microbulbifer elongatus]|uniref:sulfotransferase n=1 Tax=Microbulbifer elongatus TaxID=86173 RepID=UPI001CFCE009|nr:sulfotransferase [Microbulbifer elongatus]